MAFAALDVARLLTCVFVFLVGLFVACFSVLLARLRERLRAVRWFVHAATRLQSCILALESAKYTVCKYFTVKFAVVLEKREQLYSCKHWAATGLFLEGKDRWGSIRS